MNNPLPTKKRKPKPNALFSPMFGRRVFAIEHRPGIYTIVTNRHAVKPVVSLYLAVDAESAGVKDVIKSGLLKRLRQFSEVEIEEEIEPAFCAIFIQVMELPPGGYAISVVYTERSFFSVILSDEWRSLARSEEEKKEAEDLAKEIFKTKAFMGQSIHSCSESQLGQTLDVIVASIDSNVIEPERQFNQRAFGHH